MKKFTSALALITALASGAEAASLTDAAELAWCVQQIDREMEKRWTRAQSKGRGWSPLHQGAHKFQQAIDEFSSTLDQMADAETQELLAELHTVDTAVGLAQCAKIARGTGTESAFRLMSLTAGLSLQELTQIAGTPDYQFDDPTPWLAPGGR